MIGFARLSRRFFAFSIGFAQTWILHLKVLSAAVPEVFLYSGTSTNTYIFWKIVTLSPSAVGESTVHACMHVLIVRLTRFPAHLHNISQKYNEDFIPVPRNSRSRPHLRKLSNPQNAFPNTHTHRPPRPKTSLTTPHKHISRPRRLPLPLQHLELESKSFI